MDRPPSSAGARPGRRAILASLASLASLAALPVLATGARAQRAFPERPIRLVVPYPPGTATDNFARQATANMATLIGQPVVVENRPGANAMIGTEAVARSAADGYALLFGTDQTMCINPSLFQRMPYDPARDFAAVAGLVSFPMVLVVSPGLPVRSVADLVALAKAQPGRLTFATPGIGTTSHLCGEIFQRDSGISLTHVPYQASAAQLFADVLNGTISMLFYPYPPLKPQVEAGRMRALASLSTARPAWLADLPTLTELGYRRSIGVAWIGAYAPAGTPEDRIARLAEAFRRALDTPEVRAIAAAGATIEFRGPADLAAYSAAERDRYGEIVRLADVRLD
jgi:tripartite-type tricarboxylate transporter receptor subunit TctC